MLILRALPSTSLVQRLMLQCCCGRQFLQTNAFRNHQRSCKRTKTRLSSALESAKDNWNRRKKARLETLEIQNQPTPGPLTATPSRSSTANSNLQTQVTGGTSHENQELQVKTVAATLPASVATETLPFLPVIINEVWPMLSRELGMILMTSVE